MFPITHIWFSNKILSRINNMTALGAIFPDITIAGILSYDKTHRDGWGLYNHFKNNHSSYLDFAKAVITHTVNPAGLDYYGDEQYNGGYKGYCFQKGQFIVQDTIRVCNIPKEYGLWKSHNFIEMGIEINISRKYADLVSCLKSALNDRVLIQDICNAAEDYYNIDRGIIHSSFDSFNHFVELEDLNIYTLAKKYDIQMRAKHNISIDIEESSKLIQKCCEMVQEDFDIFIEYVEKNVKLMFKGSE